MANINSYAPQSGRIIGEDGKIYNLVDLLQGMGGGTSMEFLFGSTAPGDTTGKSGDVYLNTANGDFYKKTDAWTKIGALMGPQGPEGPQGEQGPAGADGFGTEAQYNDIIARLEALEEALESEGA